MAVTATLAAVAIGTTAYTVNEQKKAQRSQEELIAKQEAKQASLDQERKNKENQAMLQAFQSASLQRSRSLSKTSQSGSTGSSANASTGGMQVAGSKTAIGQ